MPRERHENETPPQDKRIVKTETRDMKKEESEETTEVKRLQGMKNEKNKEVKRVGKKKVEK